MSLRELMPSTLKLDLAFRFEIVPFWGKRTCDPYSQKKRSYKAFVFGRKITIHYEKMSTKAGKAISTLLYASLSSTLTANFPFQKTSFTDSLETRSTKYKVEKDFKSACMPWDIYRERTFREQKKSTTLIWNICHILLTVKECVLKTHSFTVSKSEIWQGYVL